MENNKVYAVESWTAQFKIKDYTSVEDGALATQEPEILGIYESLDEAQQALEKLGTPTSYTAGAIVSAQCYAIAIYSAETDPDQPYGWNIISGVDYPAIKTDEAPYFDLIRESLPDELTDYNVGEEQTTADVLTAADWVDAHLGKYLHGTPRVQVRPSGGALAATDCIVTAVDIIPTNDDHAGTLVIDLTPAE